MKRVNVTVWSDFVCPWCWIAKRRLERAVAAMAGQVEVVVTPKAYRLAKGMSPQNFKTALYRKFGNVLSGDRMMSAVAENGVTEGLIYNFDSMRFGDTSAAHALVKSIESPEGAQRMIERLYRAATTDGINIFDGEMLIALAAEIGVSTSFDLESPSLAADIARDELEAGKIANGVPLFVFNDRFHLSGAREATVFEKALLDAAIEVPEPFEEAGTTCSIDGCGGERAAAHR